MPPVTTGGLGRPDSGGLAVRAVEDGAGGIMVPSVSNIVTIPIEGALPPPPPPEPSGLDL